MAWPGLEFNKKMLDVSRWQGDIDFVTLANQYPDIRVIVIRLANIHLVKDERHDEFYQAAKDAGFDVASYGNINPSKQGETHWEAWMPMLGNRRPKFFMYDCETSAGMSPAKCTEIVRDVWKIGKTQHTWSMAYYTAAWWWNSNIVHGWEDDHPFVVAHWPYVVQNPDGSWRVAHNFEEMDPLLPIGNNFTPRVPTGVSPEMVVAWQFSSTGMLDGILPQKVDLNYMKKWFYNQAWGEEPPVGGCPGLGKLLRTESVSITLTAKTLDDEADKLRESAARLETYADEAEG